MGRQLQDNYRTFFIGRLRSSYFSSYYDATVGLRFNEVPRDCENLSVISRVRYIENLDLTNCFKSLPRSRFLDVTQRSPKRTSSTPFCSQSNTILSIYF